MSKNKQPDTLPGMEPATPTDHPPATDRLPALHHLPGHGTMCMVCDYLIGLNRTPVALDGGGYRHADCQMPADPPHADHESATNEPATPKKSTRPMDAMLRATAKLDRIVADMAPNMQKWAVAWLWEKYQE